MFMPGHAFLCRHVTTGLVNVLGKERAVPILNSEKQQSIVSLAVEDRIDPYGSCPSFVSFVGVCWSPGRIGT